MRVRARKDANHAEIVQCFKDLGAQVIDLSQLGNGIPDLLVMTNGRNVLVEIKDGKKFPSQQKLTPDEAEFHRNCKGEIYVINSISRAVELINKMRKF